MHRALLFLYAETPVHAGADSSAGALDLPIQREVTTGFPLIKAESLKGALRERFRPPRQQQANRERWTGIFGAEPPAPGTRAGDLRPGTLRVHEAQLVVFPAPTLTRTFVWVTSPLARARLDRKARLAGVSVKAADGTGSAAALDGPECLFSGKDQARFVLGPYTVTARHDPATESWASRLASVALPDLDEMAFFRQKLSADLFICSDELLGAISRDCAPVATRVQLSTGEEDGAPRKTVQHGPFQSEYLPAESLLAALLECDDEAHLDYVCGSLDNDVLRLGGDETLGKGLLWCHVLRQGAADKNHDSERKVVTAHP
ncbi:MAG TPA: type III-B CRISPR module RAMP protein Cmr4 [Trebonia sp.]|nr:type III-B CRISPR module RAMP protein Cmr4 [Trebonia sp.]